MGEFEKNNSEKMDKRELTAQQTNILLPTKEWKLEGGYELVKYNEADKTFIVRKKGEKEEQKINRGTFAFGQMAFEVHDWLKNKCELKRGIVEAQEEGVGPWDIKKGQKGEIEIENKVIKEMKEDTAFLEQAMEQMLDNCDFRLARNYFRAELFGKTSKEKKEKKEQYHKSKDDAESEVVRDIIRGLKGLKSKEFSHNVLFLEEIIRLFNAETEKVRGWIKLLEKFEVTDENEADELEELIAKTDKLEQTVLKLKDRAKDKK